MWVYLDFLFFSLVYLSSHEPLPYYLVTQYTFALQKCLGNGTSCSSMQILESVCQVTQKPLLKFKLKVYWIYRSIWKQPNSSVTMSSPFHNHGEFSVSIYSGLICLSIKFHNILHKSCHIVYWIYSRVFIFLYYYKTLFLWLMYF